MLVRMLARPSREGILKIFEALKGRPATPDEIAAIEARIAEKAGEGKVFDLQTIDDPTPANDDEAAPDATPEGTA